MLLVHGVDETWSLDPFTQESGGITEIPSVSIGRFWDDQHLEFHHASEITFQSESLLASSRFRGWRMEMELPLEKFISEWIKSSQESVVPRTVKYGQYWEMSIIFPKDAWV